VASLQERNGSYRVQFFHYGKLHGFTLGKVTPAEARAKAAQVDYLLMRLKQNLLTLPPGTDLVSFIRHDGRPPAAAPSVPEAPRRTVTLAVLKDRCLAAHGNGTLGANSLATCGIHLSHLCRVLGDALPLAGLTTADHQGYVNMRRVAAVTRRKEIATFRAAWNWGTTAGLTAGGFPSRGLRCRDVRTRWHQQQGPITHARETPALTHGGPA
jgi:hypothetical protein